jgi:TIR domain
LTSQLNDPVPEFGGTVFISYARADDVKPPFEETVEGWVKFFWEQLRWELTDRGVHQAKLWLDRYEIEPAEDFTRKIEETLKKARLIIPIISPNWVQRPWCRQELDRFVELWPQYAEDGIIPVFKIELPQAHLPSTLRNREGYKFYTKDTTGGIREFYWRGLRDRDSYLELVKKIAVWIAGRLIGHVPAPAKSASVPNGKIVYLAVSSDELRDAWQRIANDLAGSGYVVLPSGPLPEAALETEAGVRDALAKAALSVHFLGDSDGAKPDGGTEGIVPLQLRLAREVGASAPTPRVLWAPKWLPGNRDKKRDPFEVLTRFGGLMPGEEIYAEEATNLSQMLRARLAPTTQGAPVFVIAAAAAEDDGLVSVLSNRLQSDEITVKPRFAHEVDTFDSFGHATVMILLWGMASRASVDTLLDALAPSHAKVTVLCLSGGDDLAKQRFFREGIYVEQLPEIPPTRKSARELLVQLEIVRPLGSLSLKRPK